MLASRLWTTWEKGESWGRWAAAGSPQGIRARILQGGECQLAPPHPLHSSVSTRWAGDPAAYPKNYKLGHILLLLVFFWGGWLGQGALSVFANGRCALLSCWCSCPTQDPGIE